MKNNLSKYKSTLGNIPFELDRFFTNTTIEKAVELFDQMEISFIGGIRMGIELRTLNHWIKVLNENPENLWGKKFTFVEFIWIKIVEQLRELNVGFELIKKFKPELFLPLEIKGILTSTQNAKKYIEDLGLKDDQKQVLIQFVNASKGKTSSKKNLTILHLSIVDYIINKQPLSIAIFKNGTYQFLYESNNRLHTSIEKDRLINENYLTISISTILKDFFYSDLADLVVPKINLLSYAENKFFEVMYSGDYISISIKFKDKKIKPLEFKKSQIIKGRILDILDKKEFVSIVINQAEGGITKIENTIKVRL